MPKAMLAKFAEQHAVNVHRGDMISPSALKGCTRKLVLERTTDYYAEPKKLYYAVRGSLIHGFLEDIDLPDVSTEKRLYKRFTVGGRELVLSGQIDYYDGAEKAIEDYKTASDKVFYTLFNEGAKPEHILQTNVYRMLCDGGHLGSLEGPQVFWPVDRIEIHYVLMNQVITTGRVHSEMVNSYRSPNNGKKYKLETSRKVVGYTHRKTPTWEIKIDIPPVPLMSEADVLAHVTGAGIKTLAGFEHKAAGIMPPGVLYDGDKAWECGYCDVQATCYAHERTFNYQKFVQLTHEPS